MVRQRRTMKHRRPHGKRLNKRQKKEVKRLIGSQIEEKRFPTFAAAFIPITTGTITKWTSIAQGNTDQTRVGDDVTLTRVRVRYNVVGSATTSGIFRFIVFQWHPDDNVDVPALGSILDTSAGAPTQILADYNTQTIQKYRVLHDRVYTSYSVGGPNCHIRSINLYGRRLARKKMVFTTGTNGTNMIYSLLLSDAAANGPTVSWAGYVHYRDA